MDGNEIKKLIDEKPILFVPIHHGKVFEINSNVVVSGIFVHKSEVCWTDPSLVFSKYRPSFSLSTSNNKSEFRRFILKPYYSDLMHIFTNIFQISQMPTIDEYIAILGHIASQEHGHHNIETIQDAFKIYKIIGDRCYSNEQIFNEDTIQQNDVVEEKQQLEISEIAKQHIKNLLFRQAIYPVRNQKWLSLDDDPIIPDKAEIAMLFYNLEQAPFLELPRKDPTNIEY